MDEPTARPRGPVDDREIERDRTALVWISTEGAVFARWDGGPRVDHLPSGVRPRRRPAGSVRRGPARPAGGGRVGGHGTESRHDRELRTFLTSAARRLQGFGTVEVAGRGTVPDRFAELLRRDAASRNERVDVSTRSLGRRPSDAQLAARLRRLVDRELPRKREGRYRLPAARPTTSTGRPLRPAAGRRTLRPTREPEWRDIDEQLAAMLADSA